VGTQARRGGNPRAVGEVLAKFLRTSGLKEKLRSPEIYDCWPEVAGVEACTHSRVVGFTNCVLHVEVDSAPWLQMLATFRKPELLRSLKERMTGARIRDIKFRIGNPGGPAPDGSEGNPWFKKASSSSPRTTQETSRSSPA